MALLSVRSQFGIGGQEPLGKLSTGAVAGQEDQNLSVGATGRIAVAVHTQRRALRKQGLGEEGRQEDRHGRKKGNGPRGQEEGARGEDSMGRTASAAARGPGA